MSKKQSANKSALQGQPHSRTLYITVDGILGPLGRSQVLRYVQDLNGKGFPYALVSLERVEDLSDTTRVSELEQVLKEQGIPWLHAPFQSGGVGAVIKNFKALRNAARLAIREYGIRLIHARSYVPAMVAWTLRRHSISYLFDMRGYWFDELKDEGRWITNRFTYTVGKLIEKRLSEDAAAIVTLTQLQADDLIARLKKSPQKPVVVITTCADYVEFSPDAPIRGTVPENIRARLAGKLTVAIVGSINASYCLDESLLMFRFILNERPDAHLLCLSFQTVEFERLLKKHEIPESSYTLTSSRHDDMADWLRLIDWAFLFLNVRYSKRGSMPTKLAEFFAAGVRPIQYGCNEEVSQNVRRAGSGVVLNSLSAADLQNAAKTVAATALQPESIMRAREVTRPHFGLEAGAAKYGDLLNILHAKVDT